jgi:hypothetical protein
MRFRLTHRSPSFALDASSAICPMASIVWITPRALSEFPPRSFTNPVCVIDQGGLSTSIWLMSRSWALLDLAFDLRPHSFNESYDTCRMSHAGTVVWEAV